MLSKWNVLRQNIGYLANRNWGAESRENVEMGNVQELDVKLLLQCQDHLGEGIWGDLGKE